MAQRKICPKGQGSGFRYRVAEKSAEIMVFESRLLLCPVGFVLRYNKQGLCVPKSQSKAADFLAVLLFGGLPPPIPRKGEMILWGKIYESPCVSRQKKKRKLSTPIEPEVVEQLDTNSLKSIHKTSDDSINWTEVLVSPIAPDETYNQQMWAYYHNMAPKILAGDIDSYLQLIYEVNPLDDLLVYGSNYEFGTDDPKKIEVEFNININALSEAKRKISCIEYNLLLQDYVCSVCIRITRDIRLTFLVPELQEYVDGGKMKMLPAYELSFLDEEAQRDIVDNIDETETFPSHAQARRMRRAFEEGKLDYDTVTVIMNELKPNQVEKLKIPMDDIRKYVPKSMTTAEMQAYLLKLVQQDCERKHNHDAR